LGIAEFLGATDFRVSVHKPFFRERSDTVSPNVGEIQIFTGADSLRIHQ
jgi:hypothetical protein